MDKMLQSTKYVHMDMKPGPIPHISRQVILSKPWIIEYEKECEQW